MEYHVSTRTGHDDNTGTAGHPFRTVGRASAVAVPGDTIAIHDGVYRERVNPPRGGDSDQARIVYRSAPGETAVLCGSEVVRDWSCWRESVWCTNIDNTIFSSYNPFATLITGDWFDSYGRTHHTGSVFVNGHWLIETDTIDDLIERSLDEGETRRFWFAEVDSDSTRIYADFGDIVPEDALVEVTARETVFYPDAPGKNFITVQGLVLRHAATPWAPPTAEQVGLIGTHWSYGWIIERNEIAYSRCAGLSLGKYGDQWDNTSEDSAEGYVATIERALARNWAFGQIGGHLVRGNVIHDCEQAGIVGSLGAIDSLIEDNEVSHIHVQRRFGGAEQAGIKLHAPLDTVIRRNRVHHTNRGLWLDWMTQGTRVSGNLFYANDVDEDLFLEVNHGPYLVDNNTFLSRNAIRDLSEGGAFLFNYVAGIMQVSSEPRRSTPWMEAGSTAIAGLAPVTGGDNHFYGNTFVGPGATADVVRDTEKHHGLRWKVGFGLSCYDDSELATQGRANRYLRGASVLRSEGPDQAFTQPTGAPERVALDELGATRVAAIPFSRIAGCADGVIPRSLW
ncbi:MAG: right-handed parallel beta-helix repeat-containing protein [Spirochaetota bacterium]